MSRIIDFHSHILPGVDDGSASLEETITLLQMEASQGVSHVVATPHFYPQHDSPERFLERRANAEQILREMLEKHPELPGVTMGAEVYFYHGISNSDAISELTIGKKRCILIEMPGAPWTESMYRELEALYVKRGFVPIIAHLDRYIGRFHTFGIPKRLEELPVMVQANAEFFLHRSTSAMALRMLKRGRIHLLGSDCHNLTSRKPNLGEATDLIRKRLGEEALDGIASWGEAALNGRPF